MVPVSTFAERLRTLLDEKKLSQADLSRKCGLSRATLSRYLQGQFEAKQDSIYKIARATGVSEAWLLGADVPMDYSPVAHSRPNPAPIPPGFEPLPSMRKVPLIGSIACGQPITAEENVVDLVDAPNNIRCDFALRCAGDSMIDAGISDGDVVFIRSQPEVHNGQIAAVRIGDEATLKRVYWDGKVLMLIAENRSFPPMQFSGPELEQIHIEGRAVGFLHWF